MSATLPLDLERYPIDDLGSPAARELVERCRSQLDREGLCMLPGFLGREAVSRSAAEIQAEVPDAFRKERAIVAMNESEIDPALPADDPLRTAHRHSMRTIAYDLIDPASPIRALYEWDGMTGFLSAVLGYRVYRCADPLIALMISAMDQGGEQGWHFDDNEFVVSLLLVPAAGSVGNATGAMVSTDPSDAPGTILLGRGIRLKPASTLSGYCIDAPTGYQGTGAANSPAITAARPLCR